jgi:hypothetical protein
MPGIHIILRESFGDNLKIFFSSDKVGNFYLNIREEITEDTMRKVDFFIPKDLSSSFREFLEKIIPRLETPTTPPLFSPPFPHQHRLNDTTLLHVIEPPSLPGQDDGKDTMTPLVFLFYYNETVYCLDIPSVKIDDFLNFLQNMVNLIDE